MSAPKKVSRQLRQLKLWAPYAQKFKRGPMQLILSKLALDFNFSGAISALAEQEALLITRVVDENLYTEAFTWLGNELSLAYDWAALGKCCFYLYQMQTFKIDQKKRAINVYQNAVAANEQKRAYYYAWLHSIPLSTPHYNKVIKQVMHRLF